MKQSFGLVICLLSLFLINSLARAETSTTEDAKYVSVHIEIKELQEAGLVLKQATEKLSHSLNTISDNVHDLSPEQLVQINTLADKMNLMTKEFHSAMAELPKTIDNAKVPTEQLLANSLTVTKRHTIDPIVSTVESWITMTIIALCILGVCLLLAVAVGFKAMSVLGDKLKDIADGYRVVPIDQYNSIQTKQIEKTNNSN